MTTKTKLVKRQSSVLLPERDIDKSPVLECVGLGVTFGGLKAVEDFDLTIGRTEIAGLIGPNGAGKTTVFNLLTKVYQPTAGAIVFSQSMKIFVNSFSKIVLCSIVCFTL